MPLSDTEFDRILSEAAQVDSPGSFADDEFDAILNQVGQGAPSVEALQGPIAAVPQVPQTPAPERGIGEEFVTQIGAGIQQVGGAAAALGADIAGAIGAEQAEQELLELSQGLNLRAPERTITDSTQVETLGDFVMFASGLLGQQAPIMATTLLGGGLGAAATAPAFMGRFGAMLGRLIGTGRLSAPAAGQVAAKLAPQARNFGWRFQVGAAATAGTIEGGFAAQEFREATGEGNLAASLTVGAINGMLESVGPRLILSRFGVPFGKSGDLMDKISKAIDKIPNRAGRALATGGLIAPFEGLTETLQEAVVIATREFVDENFDLLGAENAARLREAAIAGTLVGGIFGGLAGGAGSGVDKAQRTRATQDVEPALDTPGALPTPFDRREILVAAPGEDGGFNLSPDGIIQRRMKAFAFVTPGQNDPIVGQFGPEEIENVGFFELDPRSVAPDEVSATLDSAVVNGIDSSDAGNVRFVGDPAVEQEARATFENAKSLLALGQRLVVGGGGGAQVVQAQQAIDSGRAEYLRALEQGLRVTPVKGQGFLFLGENLPPSAKRTLEAPRSLLAQPSFVLREDGRPAFLTGVDIHGNEFIELSQELELGVTAQVQAIGEPGARTIDLNLLPREQISGGDISLRQAIKGLRPEEITKGVLESRGFLFTKGSDSQAIIGAVLRNNSHEVFAAGGRVPFSLNQLEALQMEASSSDQISESLFVATEDVATLPLVEAPGRPRLRRFLRNQRDTEQRRADVASIYDRVVPQGIEPGVVHAAVPRFNKDLATQLARLAQRVVTRIMPDARVLMTFNEVQEQGGSWFGRKGQHIININPSKLAQGDARAVIVLAHELGHAISYEKFYDAPAGVQEAIIRAFNRTNFRSTLGTVEDLSLERSNIAAAADFAGRDDLARNMQEPEYWFSFDEWFAEQTARWMTTTKEPLTLIDSFFKGVAQSYRKMMEIVFGARVDRARAEPEMRAYLDALFARRDANAEPILQSSMNEWTTDASLEAEASIDTLGMKDSADPVPPQPEVTIFRQMFRNLQRASPAFAKAFPPQEQTRLLLHLDNFFWWNKWLLSPQQVARQNPHIGAAQEYVQLLDLWAGLQNRWYARADTHAREWKKLNDPERARFGELLFEVEKLESNPTLEQLAELFDQFNISPDGQDLYREVTQDFRDVLDDMEAASKLEVINIFSRDILTPELEQRLLAIQSLDEVNGFLQAFEELALQSVAGQGPKAEAQIFDTFKRIEEAAGTVTAEFEALRARPYFPHARFGEWGVTVRDSEGTVVYFETFESEKSRRKELRSIERAMDDGDQITLDRITSDAQTVRGLPRSVLNALEKRGKLSEKQRQFLEQYALELAPSTSFRKRFTRRKGVAGFSSDALRSYSQYFFQAPKHIARITYGPRMQDAIERLLPRTAAIRETGASIVDIEARSTIKDFYQSHLDHVMNPGKDWAWMRSTAFIWHLGAVPSSAALNLTQVPMVAWPFLSKRFGTGQANTELLRAYKDLRKIYKSMGEGDAAAIPQGEFDMLNWLVQNGTIDESMASELAATTKAQTLAKTVPGNAAQKILHNGAQWASYLFQSAEKVNRRVVARAAYRLALRNLDSEYLQGLRATSEIEIERMRLSGITDPSQQSAILAAQDSVRQTQFLYQDHARPSFMRGRKGVIFTFFMFQQNLMFFALNTPGRGRFMLTMLAAAGLMGLPGMEDLVDISKFIARRMGFDFDPEREVRELAVAMAETFGSSEMGPALGDLMLHGTSRFGFGLPIFGDMSASVGAGRVIPGVAGLRRPEAPFAEIVGETTRDVAGAALAIPFGIGQMLFDTAYNWDDPKRWERAMPRAMRNVSRAARFAEEGRERSARRDTIVRFDPYDPEGAIELAGQAMGFTPRRLSQTYDRMSMEREAVQHWGVRRQALLNDYDWAINVEGDRSEVREVVQDIRRYNREVPAPGMKITRDRLRQSQRTRLRNRRLRELGLPIRKGERPIVEDVQRLFPEVIDVEPVVR